MPTHAEKGQIFRDLHARSGMLLLPNPWDAGTAKLLQSLGFEALATTSLGMSNALGRVDGDGAVSRAELLENCRVIARATDLPVNADLENGYADDPKEAATILRDAAEAGVVGGSIEDWNGDRIYDLDHAVERVAAGVEMARSLKVPFTFTARAENLISRPQRSRRHDQAAESLREGGGRRALCARIARPQNHEDGHSEIGKPLNVVMSAGDPDLTAEQLAGVGVKRVSVGGALSRLALAAFMKGAREMKDRGGFTWMRETMPTVELKKVFRAD